MATWVLIVSLAAGYGASVNSVPGFVSLEVCQKAGEQWKGNLSLGAGTKASFTCVSTQ